jgi:hypothetical protein
MFSRLDPPVAQSSRATLSEEGLEMGTIFCPLNPGHQRADVRRSALRVRVAGAAGDIVWTWMTECLFSEKLIDLVQSKHLTGLTFRAATVLAPSGKPLAQNYKEVTVTGWAGMALAESGIRLEESCPGCGYLHYSCFTDPRKLIRDDQWDGSDFFIVWPLPRFIFVSPKVEDLFRRHNIGPCRFTPMSELKCGSSVGISPGRLSDWLPSDRAKALGAPLGIE